MYVNTWKKSLWKFGWILDGFWIDFGFKTWMYKRKDLSDNLNDAQKSFSEPLEKSFEWKMGFVEE